MIYKLEVPGEMLQVVWAALMEQPAKAVFLTLEHLKAQIAQQEASQSALASLPPVPPLQEGLPST